MGAEDVPGVVEKAVNNGDVDGLVALYETDACLLGPAGEESVGLDAIRATWEETLAPGGSGTMTTRSVVETGDLAYLSNHWELTIDGAVVASATTAEIAREQADGSWKYVIDHPYASEVSSPKLTAQLLAVGGGFDGGDVELAERGHHGRGRPLIGVLCGQGRDAARPPSTDRPPPSGGEEGGESLVAGVLVAGDAGDPAQHLAVSTAWPSVRIASMSTQSLPRLNTALHAMRCSGDEDRDLDIGEGHRSAAVGGGIVERVVGEEQVDGRVVPPDPRLAIACDERGGRRRRW